MPNNRIEGAKEKLFTAISDSIYPLPADHWQVELILFLM
jgi:hypothetical protein